MTQTIDDAVSAIFDGIGIAPSAAETLRERVAAALQAERVYREGERIRANAMAEMAQREHGRGDQYWARALALVRQLRRTRVTLRRTQDMHTIAAMCWNAVEAEWGEALAMATRRDRQARKFIERAVNAEAERDKALQALGYYSDEATQEAIDARDELRCRAERAEAERDAAVRRAEAASGAVQVFEALCRFWDARDEYDNAALGCGEDGTPEEKRAQVDRWALSVERLRAADRELGDVYHRERKARRQQRAALGNYAKGGAS